MTLYKHWKKEHAEDALQKGRIRLALSSFYRDVEGAPDGVRDSLEDRMVGSHRPLVGTMKPEDLENLRRAGLIAFESPGGAAVTGRIEGNIVETTIPPQYLFCLSQSDQPGLFGSSYNAITEVPEPMELLVAIQQAGSSIFGQPTWGEVAYRSRSYNLFEAGLVYPEVLVKDPAFSYEQEYRLAFSSLVSPPDEFAFVESASIKRAFRRVAD